MFKIVAPHVVGGIAAGIVLAIGFYLFQFGFYVDTETFKTFVLMLLITTSLLGAAAGFVSAVFQAHTTRR